MPILHWLNREGSIKETARVPYRLLKADPKLSYGDETSENMLIQGIIWTRSRRFCPITPER